MPSLPAAKKSTARATPSQEVTPRMVNQLDRIERRLEVAETKITTHDIKDEERFDAAHKSFVAIRQLIADSMEKIDDKLADLHTQIEAQGAKLQAQIDPLKADRIRKEGYDQGTADAKRPNQYVVAIVPVLVTFLLTAVAAWIAHDYVQPPPNEHTSTLITTQTGDRHR